MAFPGCPKQGGELLVGRVEPQNGHSGLEKPGEKCLTPAARLAKDEAEVDVEEVALRGDLQVVQVPIPDAQDLTSTASQQRLAPQAASLRKAWLTLEGKQI